MRPVNLIPPEDRRGDRAPLRAGGASYLIVGVLTAALFGVIALVITGNTITEKEDELASLEARQAAAEQRVSELAPYGEFATLADSRQETISTLAKSRFDWDRVMHELALVIPDDVWLDSLTGSVAPGVTTGGDSGAATATADTSISGPSLQITGCADGQVAVARFLAALRDIDGVTRVGMQKSSLGDKGSSGAEGTTDSTTAGSVSGDCQTREFIASFEITIAFDAVPRPAYLTPADSVVPAAVPATTETTTTETTTTDDGGTAEAETEQQSAEDSAAEQSTEAQNGAANVGVGG
ncbi:MAG: PilN domain-containing protein [Solirubrobacterales bacterium]